jgi:SMODS and SLOG-associating 2TM effector domain 1
MSQPDIQQFFQLYQTYRYHDQRDYYKRRRAEYNKAYTQATWISISLMGLTALAGGLASVGDISSWLKLLCLLLAALLPVLSTTIAAYNALYGFEQQSKLYQDTINALLRAHVFAPHFSLEAASDETEARQDVNKYVQEVEEIFLVEQGQWGQLAKTLKPHEA